MIGSSKVTKFNELAYDGTAGGSIGSGQQVEVINVDFSITSTPTIPVIEYRGDANSETAYLTREIVVYIYNSTGDHRAFRGNKITVSGSKYIGIQQDEFKIVMQNINYYDFGVYVNSGYKFVRVTVGDSVVFDGTIRSINTGRDNIVERTLEINCLRKVTDLLSDMVVPITVDSSMNIWAVMEEQFPDLTFITPETFKALTFPDTYTFEGYKKTVIDTMIQIANSQLSRLTNNDVNWLDYSYEGANTINLFSPYTIEEVLNMQPYTGLIDAPAVSEDSITFNSIYKEKLVPGRVVYMDNSLFKTLGNKSAFIYAWDPNGLYVITEVRYSFANYPTKFTVSCKARPLSKYNNFTASLGG